MPRGRSIDRTLPPTRSLTAQRDYRARKVAKQRELEDSVAQLAAENAALRAEVADLRARVAQPDRLVPSQLDAVASAHAQLIAALHQLEGVVGGIPPMAATGASYHSTVQEGVAVSQYGNTNHRQHSNPITPSLASPDPRSLSMSPSLSEISMSTTGAPRFVGQFDPNCCDGLFDCSALPGIPVSDTRSAPPSAPMAPPISIGYHVPTSTPNRSCNGISCGPRMDPPPASHPEADKCCLGIVDCDPPPRISS